MNVVDPKLDFQTFHDGNAIMARSTFPQPWFRNACNVSLAQLASNGTTAEELAGVRKFLNILINIGEKPVPVQRLPVVTLDQS